jgi:triacylglycerol lipase
MSHKTSAIVFVPGLASFSPINLGILRIEYFRGVEQSLEEHGTQTYFPTLPPFAGVAQRARVLANSLSKLKVGRIHLVAHSMGGLDSRYCIHHFDPERRIASLVTIGTPHRGTPLANWVLEEDGLFQWVTRPWVRTAALDLTPESCQRFNDVIPDRTDVRYLSYAGVRPVTEMPSWFRPWTRMLGDKAGENDSQVPLSSAMWGEFKRTLRADHVELVGWNLGRLEEQDQRPFDHLAFYQGVVAELLKGER